MGVGMDIADDSHTLHQIVLLNILNPTNLNINDNKILFGALELAVLLSLGFLDGIDDCSKSGFHLGLVQFLERVGGIPLTA